MKHKYRKGLKKLQNRYHKIRKELGDEEYEFFRTNNDYEEFKKHHPLLKKAILANTPKSYRFIMKKYFDEL